jgi:hypothetical protein
MKTNPYSIFTTKLLPLSKGVLKKQTKARSSIYSITLPNLYLHSSISLAAQTKEYVQCLIEAGIINEFQCLSPSITLVELKGITSEITASVISDYIAPHCYVYFQGQLIRAAKSRVEINPENLALLGKIPVSSIVHHEAQTSKPPCNQHSNTSVTEAVNNSDNTHSVTALNDYIRAAKHPIFTLPTSNTTTSLNVEQPKPILHYRFQQIG